MRYSLKGKRVFVAGHRGLVGRALTRRLAREDCTLLQVNRHALDLRHKADVERWMAAERPQAIFVAAATVGGIRANDTRPAEFLYDNLAIALSVIDAARQAGVEKLLYLSSSCVYPREADQPLTEEALLTGPLEPTNQWYAVAKIAGLKMCQAYRRQYGADFIVAMPTSLYGPGDRYDTATSHVIPALILRLHQARLDDAPEVVIWGSGRPLREFLYIDDLADALVRMMTHYSGDSHLNIGSGQEISIRQLAEEIRDLVGYSGRLVFDTDKPDGMPRKRLAIDRMTADLDWQPQTSLREGLRRTYEDFLATAAASTQPLSNMKKAES